MYHRDVNGLELLVLGRTLMKIGGDAIPVFGLQQLPSSVRSVMVDVIQHPDTSISEIMARTGYPQSHVSTSVGRLQEAGALTTTVDPKDRRRTLVRARADAPRSTLEIGAAAVDNALAAALGTDDADEVREAVAMLEDLAKRLAP
jgi:DNA-binding MarR family transcriptional regulator